MSILSTPEKATIYYYPNDSKKKLFDCMFRPSKIGYSKGAHWSHDHGGAKTGGSTSSSTSKPKAKLEVPKVQYGGGHPQKWTFDLFFDTTDSGKNVQTEYIDKLLKLVKQQSGQKPPHLAEFVWGSFSTKKSYVESLSVSYTLFLPSGAPVRAEVSNISFVEFHASVGAQNPTSYSEARETWIVHEGDRLDLIAWKVYKDASAWRHIALTNHLDNPADLHPGQVLKLVPKHD
jgi:nucleoid-associated protein YgaU